MCIRDRAYSVTVKTGYNPTRLKDEGVQVFTIKAELYLSLIHISIWTGTFCPSPKNGPMS